MPYVRGFDPSLFWHASQLSMSSLDVCMRPSQGYLDHTSGIDRATVWSPGDHRNEGRSKLKRVSFQLSVFGIVCSHYVATTMNSICIQDRVSPRPADSCLPAVLARSVLRSRLTRIATLCERLVRDQVDRKGEKQRQRDSHASCGERHYV